VGKPSLYAAKPYAKAEGRVFLLVPAYPGCPGTKAVKRLLLLLVVVVPELALPLLLSRGSDPNPAGKATTFPQTP